MRHPLDWIRNILVDLHNFDWAALNPITAIRNRQP